MTLEIKDLQNPDEVRHLPKTKIEVVKVGSYTVMRLALQPGWKWSECVKPTAGTESCQAPHLNYIVSGKLKIQMNNGEEVEIGSGEVANIPPGHDAWVLGNEPCIAIDFTAGEIYGKSGS